ncbi:MAG: glycosyltransferase [Candidatus Gracilibacteria bacterium]
MTAFENKSPKVAIVTDWMTSHGGETRVLFALHELFPEAPIYTTVYNPENVPQFKNAKVITSFIHDLPFAKKKHQWFLGLMPLAFESFDLSEYDIVISSSHACSKGIITKVDTLHICYCHTPMRYAWDDCHRYINENAPFKNLGGKWFASRLMHKIRMWDRLAADRVDSFIANSKYIRKRIQKYYQRDSKVIYPPIQTSNFQIAEKKEDFYLAGGRIVENKRYDLIVEAFNDLGYPLKIFGKGPYLDTLKAMAKPNIEFLGFTSDEENALLYAQAKAYIVPQLEDFGITTVEAMSAGTPVIGLRDGGTEEIVIDGITGVLMDEQSSLCLIQMVKKIESMKFDPNVIRQNALKFDVARFKREIKNFVMSEFEDWKGRMNVSNT